MIRIIAIAFLLLAFPALAQQHVGPLQTQNNLAEIAKGGGAAQSAARANLGLGALATQGAGAVAITGGTISGADGSGITVMPVGRTAQTLATILGQQIDSLSGAGGIAPPVGDGITDDQPALQAMANAVPATGGVMYVRWGTAGKYLLGAPLLLHSNTTLVCTPNVVFSWKNPFTNGAYSSVAHGGQGGLIANVNWAATSITDHDITVIDCGADGTAYTNNGNHAFNFRGVERPRVYRPRCNTMGDCTAFVLSDSSVVEDGYAVNISNVCWDHWEGVTNITVRGGYCQSSLYGTMVTGTNSNSSSAQISARGTITGGQYDITGPNGAGVDLNGLGPSNWVPAYAFYAGDMTLNAGGFYTETVASCVSGASSPPTGTGTGIVDGTCLWNYTATAGVGQHGSGVQYVDVTGVHVRYTNSAQQQLCFNITGASSFNRIIGGDCYQGVLYMGGDAGGYATYNTVNSTDVVSPNNGASGAAVLLDTGSAFNVIDNVRVTASVGNIGYSFYDGGTNMITNAHPAGGIYHFPTSGHPNSIYTEADGNYPNGGTRVLSGVFGAALPHDSGAVFVASVTTGATQTMGQNTDGLMLENASAVATQTVKLPPITAQSGQTAWIGSLGGITTLTVQTSTGGAITGSATSIAAGATRRLISDGTTWYPVQ